MTKRTFDWHWPVMAGLAFLLWTTNRRRTKSNFALSGSEDIAQAQGSIHLESYIWWTGDICERIAHALAGSARRGIEVRLLLDYSGSSRTRS